MRHKTLFLIILVLQGCASTPPATQHSSRDPETVFQALAAAGVPYRRGGESHASGFDCSGLVAHVYQESYGIRLPHNARAQSEIGRKIALADIEPGDLVFYHTEGPFSHVGIYLGEDRFIHAPKPGASVRVEDMRSAYWTRRFDGARRIPIPQ
jgi:cell wall-associated NlpC family hydrolase